MNGFFDITHRQLNFLVILVAVILVLSGYWFIRAHAVSVEPNPVVELFVGEDQPPISAIFSVDPNKSPADSLELLPGIGKVLADRIVGYRRHELFKTEIDITRVKGIGPKLYEKIKPYLKVVKY